MAGKGPSDSPPSYAASQQLCSICAQPLPFPSADSKPSSSAPPHIQQPCCGRCVCGTCLDQNPCFGTYCPFCPTSTHLLPPSYNASATPLPPSPNPKSITPVAATVEDTIHFLRPHDTVTSLSLQYNVPKSALRSHNRIFSEHLLSARHTVAIPGSLYQGPSLSPRPIEGEEEETRKGVLKRFQIRTKCVDPEMAEVYLKDADWRLKEAEKRWWEDEGWVREQETQGKGKGKAEMRFRR